MNRFELSNNQGGSKYGLNKHEVKNRFRFGWDIVKIR
jgi:hypothetical protein